MTFTEAAIEVLRREGKPLHFTKIAEIAARDDLLDHVGKIPEETMAGQLVDHCRLPKADRRVIAVQHGVFALTEWGLDEDPAGIEGLVELPPADELPYRGRERHPIPSRDVARSTGRGEGRRRREEGEERRPKRFPPPAEVAYEILAGAGKPLGLQDVALQGAERLLMPDAFVRDLGSLRSALQEDNRRRESSGRKALFAIEGDSVTLVAQPEPGERAALPRAAASGADLRRTALAALRRRLRECDAPTFEHVAGAILAGLGYLELKVVKRGREHAIYTARRRLGAAELRHAIRVLRGHAEVGRRDVQDLRRDLSNYGAQLGVVVGVGDVQREARSEACAGGQLPIVLLCGEALAEAATEASVGCRQVVVPDIDEVFFREAAVKGAREEEARRARREERERREGRRGEERRREEGAPAEVAVTLVAGDGTPEAEAAPESEPSGDAQPAIIEVRATLDEAAVAFDADDGEEGEGDDEGPDDGADELPAGQPGEAGASAGAAGASEGGEGRRRRRRRRRRRGGRGRREGGAAVGPGGDAGAPGSGATAAGETSSAPTAPPAPAEPPSGGGGADGG